MSETPHVSPTELQDLIVVMNSLTDEVQAQKWDSQTEARNLALRYAKQLIETLPAEDPECSMEILEE